MVVAAGTALVLVFVWSIVAPGSEDTLGWCWDKSDISLLACSHRYWPKAVRWVLPESATALRYQENASIVVIVTSAATSSERRERLRRQFAVSMRLTEQKVGLVERETAIIKFLIGKADKKDMLQDRVWQSVRNESLFYGDIIFLNCSDYDGFDKFWPKTSATTTKVLLGIDWAVHNYNFEYLVRLGDDAYFRIDNFLLLMKQGALPSSKAVLGYVTSGANINEEGFTYKYPSGMGYAVTYDLCAWISASKDMLIDSWPEDGMMGRWVIASKAKLFHMPTRFSDYSWGRCSNHSLIIHKLPDNAWNKIDTAGLLKCSKL